MHKLRLFSTLIMVTTLMVAFQNCGETKFRKNAQSSTAAPEEIQTSSETPITLLDQTIFEGQPVTFQAVLGVEAAEPAFVWSFSGNILETTSVPEFSISAAQLEQQGIYEVVYFDGETQLGSAQANLTVIQQFFDEPPVFTQHPSGANLKVGQKLTLSALAVGDPSPTYQWEKNGNPISGATNATLTIAAVKTTDTANYQLIATNTAGTVKSSVAAVIVTQPTDQSCGYYFRKADRKWNENVNQINLSDYNASYRAGAVSRTAKHYQSVKFGSYLHHITKQCVNGKWYKVPGMDCSYNHTAIFWHRTGQYTCK